MDLLQTSAEHPSIELRSSFNPLHFQCAHGPLRSHLQVFKAFDDHKGVDVAWNKIYLDVLGLSEAEELRLKEEVAQGRTLIHDNIIKMLKFFVGEADNTVNFITELFTSGNLRQFRKKHRDLEMNTLRKFGRQILVGLKVHCPPFSLMRRVSLIVMAAVFSPRALAPVQRTARRSH